MAAFANTVGTVEHDSELLRRTALGDHGSLKELHSRYSGILLATAFRVLNNVKDAEEVVQEAFVQIWEKASIYDVQRGKPLTWAMTLTRNKAIDRLRRPLPLIGMTGKIRFVDLHHIGV